MNLLTGNESFSFPTNKIYIYIYIDIFFWFEGKLKLSYPVNKFIIITYWHISRQLKAVTSTFYDWSCKVYLHTIIDFEGISAQFKRQGKLLLTQALMFLNRQWMRYSTWFISSFDGTLLMISKLSYHYIPNIMFILNAFLKKDY